MTKKINPSSISFLLDIAIDRAKRDLEKGFVNWPDDPTGVEVSWEDLEEEFDSLVQHVYVSIEKLLGGKLPEVVTPVPDPITPTVQIEKARYAGRKGDSKRPVYYFKKRMEDYPSDFIVTIENCGEMIVTGNVGLRLDYDEYYERIGQSMSSDRSFIRQSLVTTDPRGMVVVGPKGCKSKVCYLTIREKTVNGAFPPTNPQSNPSLGSYNTIDVVRNLRFIHNKAFTWLPYTGAAYAKGISATFVWPELGHSLFVPNMLDNFSPMGYDHETYFCGTKNKPEESNGTRASVFGPAGKKASFVEIHYNK